MSTERVGEYPVRMTEIWDCSDLKGSAVKIAAPLRGALGRDFKIVLQAVTVPSTQFE